MSRNAATLSENLDFHGEEKKGTTLIKVLEPLSGLIDESANSYTLM